MSPPLEVVPFRNAHIPSFGHAASSGNTLHVAFLEGDGVEKARRGAYFVGNAAKSDSCSWIVSNGNKFAPITLVIKMYLKNLETKAEFSFMFTFGKSCGIFGGDETKHSLLSTR
jgi:hypothetical protein